MSLDFFNNLKENLSNNEVISNITEGIQDFLTEVSDRLNDNENNNLDIVSEITTARTTSLSSENSIMKARDEILREYAKNTTDKGDLYFIFNKIKDSDDYRVIQMGKDIDTTLKVNVNELPEGSGLNQVMRLKDGIFELDEIGTENVLNKIYIKAEEILDRQDRKLQEYRKDGHIYVVTEDINNRIFLWDTTSKPDFEIEEVNFPRQLLNEAKEGNKFIYKNGEYERIED